MFNFIKIRLSSKLITGFLIGVIFLGSINVFSIIIYDKFRNQMATQLVLISTSQYLEIKSKELYALVVDFTLAREEKDIESLKPEILDSSFNVSKSLDNLLKMNAVDKIFVANIEKGIRDGLKLTEDVMYYHGFSFSKAFSDMEKKKYEVLSMETLVRMRVLQKELGFIVANIVDQSSLNFHKLLLESKRIERVIWVIMILAIFGMIFFSYFFANYISKPLELLKEAATQISKGKLRQKVVLDTGDEISELAEVFNNMAYRLRLSYSTLEEKIKEKTDELAKSLKKTRQQNTDLEESKKVMLNILEDVENEKAHVLQEKERTSIILQSIGDSVFVVDNQKKIILFNNKASQIFGASRKVVLGKKYNSIIDFTSEEDGKSHNFLIDECLATGKMPEIKGHTILSSKKKKMPVSISVAALFDRNRKVMGCVVVIRDIAKEREIDKAKSEFVSLASHQLRTPLSSINWYSEMLLDEDAGKLNKEQKTYVNEIYSGNQRMVSLVNSLLNVSRIEMGTFIVEPSMIDIIHELESVLLELSPDINSKGLNIEKKFSEKVIKMMVDPKLIRIVFQNLLSNAVKYTPNKGTVKLSIKKQTNDLLIELSDTGYGIPKAEQSHIFTKLYRADNVKKMEVEGTGLGLYLVKSIIDQSKGKISFESKENKGTTFYVTLPMKGMEKKVGSKSLS